jgi:hypothetical protein
MDVNVRVDCMRCDRAPAECTRVCCVHVQDATCRWMRTENPARSGDTQVICWMTQDKEDFYCDEYRSVVGYCAIIEVALDSEEFGDDLIAAIRAPYNSWLRNVKKYLDARGADRLGDLRIKQMRGATAVLDAVVVELALNDMERAKGLEKRREEEEEEGEEEEGEKEDEEKDTEEEETEDDAYILNPRAMKTFYETILAKERLWQRPPHNHCTRCEDYDKVVRQMKELNAALASVPADLDHAKQEAVIEANGGSVPAWAKLRKAQDKLPDLKLHVTWRDSQRGYVMTRFGSLQEHEAGLDLDYGGFTDSEGKKFSVWSATVLTKGTEKKPHHLDIFFDAANQVKKRPGAKKNAQTGIFCWGELLDPAKAPDPDGVCLFSRLFPGKSHLLLSGDTGNGYRAYEMLESLSEMFATYGFSVELINLPPNHAHNRTDARIAHQNTLLNKIMKRSRIFGAEQAARAFELASNPNLTVRRKFMARSHIFFRVVPPVDPRERGEKKKLLGAMLVDVKLETGNTGVRSLLYFDFSVKSENGNLEHPSGYARVRVHGDPQKRDNPTFVYTWRHDLLKSMCQWCSNRAGPPCSSLFSYPPPLLVHTHIFMHTKPQQLYRHKHTNKNKHNIIQIHITNTRTSTHRTSHPTGRLQLYQDSMRAAAQREGGRDGSVCSADQNSGSESPPSGTPSYPRRELFTATGQGEGWKQRGRRGQERVQHQGKRPREGRQRGQGPSYRKGRWQGGWKGQWQKWG